MEEGLLSSRATSGVINWIKNQPVERWALFTLEFPRFNHIDHWNRPLTETFGELCHTYPPTSHRRKCEKTDRPILHRIVTMGGDRVNGVALHVQGLIEQFSDDTDYLQDRLGRAWKSAVSRHCQHVKRVVEKEAIVWTKSLIGEPTNHLIYLQRYEGCDLNFGINKVVLGVTALSEM